MNEEKITYESDEKKRIDKFLSEKIPISRGRIKTLIKREKYL